MCSGVKFKKTAALKLINLWRNCLMPSEVTSSTAYLQPASTAWRKTFCIIKRPGMVIFIVFFHSLSATLNLIEDVEATLCPASSNILQIKSMVVDFPLVQVTPITINLPEGKPYTRALKKAHSQW